MAFNCMLDFAGAVDPAKTGGVAAIEIRPPASSERDPVTVKRRTNRRACIVGCGLNEDALERRLLQQTSAGSDVEHGAAGEAQALRLCPLMAPPGILRHCLPDRSRASPGNAM